jgi:glutathione S-transferase
MLVLRSSATSPFGRKVKIAASVMGLRHRISVEMADTLDPSDSLRVQNPLGKIPALILDDGTVLFDSRVIVEYLDHLAGGQQVIPAAPGRFTALRMQALADGICDAGLLQVLEARFRPTEKHEAKWLDHQSGKVRRALDVLEHGQRPEVSGQPDIGGIALACALGYLDLRFPEWRRDYTALPAWVDTFERAVPSFGDTRAPA